ncbi:MAG TPA: cytochrome c [Caldimonas sp.]|jgi:mono/diheme cytochrome c family protein|nr:cytochrome c [Caldimonas sp.]HEX2542127.1 cytochrome c [Caldimonas sp.]
MREARTSSRWRRGLLLALVVLALAGIALAALAWRPEIAPIDPPARSAFEPQLIERGAQMASAGNCIGCHATPDGRPFAGGLPLETPFGTLYSTNITPDEETGLGRWSQEAFDRAMREGVDRRGAHLYPAFPYTHYTRVNAEDLRALYAYLMTRTPVRARAPDNELAFPLGFRPLLAGWKLLFFRPDAYRPDPTQNAEWNRGAYLAEGLGHCSACHSPRNAFGAERRDQHLNGGFAEGWYSPALNASSPSPLPWTVDELTTYLRTGLAENHAIAGGPMQGVVRSLARLPESDVHAIATYIHAAMGGPTPERAARAKASAQRAALGPLALATSRQAAPSAQDEPALRLGAAVYAGACAGCHELGRELGSGSGLQLPLAVAVHEPSPASLIRIVLEGITPAEGERGRWMPAFAGALTEEQTVALTQYLRRAAADMPPWPDVAGEVRKARHR